MLRSCHFGGFCGSLNGRNLLSFKRQRRTTRARYYNFHHGPPFVRLGLRNLCKIDVRIVWRHATSGILRQPQNCCSSSRSRGLLLTQGRQDAVGTSAGLAVGQACGALGRGVQLQRFCPPTLDFRMMKSLAGLKPLYTAGDLDGVTGFRIRVRP